MERLKKTWNVLFLDALRHQTSPYAPTFFPTRSGKKKKKKKKKNFSLANLVSA